MNPGQEHDREFVRYDLGIYIHGAENVKRVHIRSAERAKCGLNILLVAVVALGWATCFNFAIAPHFVTLAILYALAVIITPNESPKEL